MKKSGATDKDSIEFLEGLIRDCGGNKRAAALRVSEALGRPLRETEASVYNWLVRGIPEDTFWRLRAAMGKKQAAPGKAPYDLGGPAALARALASVREIYLGTGGRGACWDFLKTAVKAAHKFLEETR